MTKIKLCGMKSAEDIAAANALQPDYVGFVFAGSKRRLTIEQAMDLRPLVAEGIAVAGVFVDEPIVELIETVISCRLSVIQLHGHEDAHYLRELETKLGSLGAGIFSQGLEVWKAVCVQSAEELLEASDLAVVRLLLDAKVGNGAGSGERFDWGILEDVEPALLRERCFLAGGLDEHNVSDAVERFHPYGVDVSSGIETDGRKDPVKMKNFVEAVRRADGKQRK